MFFVFSTGIKYVKTRSKAVLISIISADMVIMINEDEFSFIQRVVNRFRFVGSSFFSSNSFFTHFSFNLAFLFMLLGQIFKLLTNYNLKQESS